MLFYEPLGHSYLYRTFSLFHLHVFFPFKVALSSLAAIESVYSTVLYATEAMTVETTVTK